jgi:hypothetical protein
MIEINKDLTRSQELTTGALLALFFGLIGAIVLWRTDATFVVYVLWSVGVALGLLYYAVPSLRRPLYLGWMYAVYPIGWTVSHVLLGVLYYLVVTPVGLVLRALGRDPMHRRFDPAAETYWLERPARRDAKSYFRQF